MQRWLVRTALKPVWVRHVWPFFWEAALSGAFLVVLLSGSPGALAQSSPASAPAAGLGAEVGGLLERVSRMHPAVVERVLESDAAGARTVIEGSLPDPMFQVEFRDLDRVGGGAPPNEVGSVKYTVEQEFPLWGRRDLRRSIAAAEARGARSRVRATETELATRVKAAFAQYYRASHALRTTREIQTLIGTAASLAQARYAQGTVGQQDPIDAEGERTRLSIMLATLERERAAAAARLNALANRPPAAPLAEPQTLRPVPPRERMPLDRLLQQAAATNPEILMNQAELDAAREARELAGLNALPDVTVGLSVVQRDWDVSGYEAMFRFRIPLQGGLREAQRQEAAALQSAREARLQATSLTLQGEIETASQTLEETRRVLQLIETTLIPQTSASIRAALAAYQRGDASMLAIFEAERRALQARLDQLTVQAEQQMTLAEIERLIGGDL